MKLLAKPWASSGIRLIWLSGLIIILDQVTKLAASSYIDLYERIPVFSFFNFTLAHNEGAAFSFLADAGGWQRWFFAAIAIIVSTVILIWMYQNDRKERWLNVALAMVLGGALGNLIDRIYLGYVVDFLDFYWQDIHFPAFNVADSAICIGAFMLFLDVFFEEKKSESPERASE